MREPEIGLQIRVHHAWPGSPGDPRSTRRWLNSSPVADPVGVLLLSAARLEINSGEMARHRRSPLARSCRPLASDPHPPSRRKETAP